MNNFSAPLDERQRLIFDWIIDTYQLPVFASAYAGAICLLRNECPGYVTFVAHVGRDFINLFAPAARGITSSRVEYKEIVDRLDKEWVRGHPLQGIEEVTSIVQGEVVSKSTHETISELIEKHRAGTARSENKIELFFTTFLDYNAAPDIPPNVAELLGRARGWFLKHAHCRKDDFSSNVDAEVRIHFNVLEDLLEAAARSQHDHMVEINEILEEANSTND